MQLLSGLATLAFVVVGATVGIRLLILGHRTKELPERSVGLALLLIGGIGYPLAVLAGTPGVMDPTSGVRLSTVSTVIIDAGFIAVSTFTWSVFRRNETWGRMLFGLLVVGYVTHAIVLCIESPSMTHPSELMTKVRSLTLAGQLLNSIAFGWTAIEAYRYWWMLRKRAAIGLGDPVTTNRFLLWGFAATASVLTNAVSWWVVAAGIDFFEHDGVQAAIGLLSVASCTSQYLAFLPPKAYVARIRGRVEA
jgi:hypothetical protein